MSKTLNAELGITPAIRLHCLRAAHAMRSARDEIEAARDIAAADSDTEKRMEELLSELEDMLPMVEWEPPDD